MIDYKKYEFELGNCQSDIDRSDVPAISFGWRPINPYCVQDEYGNTGLIGYRNLQLFDTSTGIGLGITVPNHIRNPNYVPPTDTIVTDRYIMGGYIEDYYFEMETESAELTCPITGWIDVFPESISLGYGNQNFDLDIKSNTNWNITNPSPGLSFSSISGNSNATVTVTVDENTDVFPITKSFFVNTGGGASATVVVSQEALDPTQISVSPTALNFPVSGGSLTINVDTPQTWDFSESIPWAGVTRSGDTLTVNANNNTAGTRNGNILIEGDLSSVVVPVKQQGVALYQVQMWGNAEYVGEFRGADTPDDAMSNPHSQVIFSTAQVSNIGIGTRFFMDNQAQTPIDGDAKWYRIGTTALAVQIDSGGYFLASVDTGISLEVTPDVLTNSPNAATREIYITSNTAWTNYAAPGWVSNVNPSSGSGNQTVTIQIQANTSPTPRTGNVSFRTTNQQRTAAVQIQQQGVSPISPTNVSMPKAGGSFSISITTSGAWDVQTPLPSEIYIAPGQLSGFGDSIISVSVNQNPSENARLITIIIVIGGVNHYVDIQQAGTDV